MTFLDNFLTNGRSSAWSELKRRCPQKRHIQKLYWCFCVMAAVFPFTMLRMVYICNLTYVKEPSLEISVEMMETEERLPHIQPHIISSGSTGSELDVRSSTLQGSRITLHERASTENSRTKFGDEFGPGGDWKAKDMKHLVPTSKRKHSSRQSSGSKPHEESHGLPGNPVEKQEERSSRENTIPAGEIANFQENEEDGAGHSSVTQDEVHFGLTREIEEIDSMAMLVPEEDMKHDRDEKKQDEKPAGEFGGSPRETAEERHTRDREVHLHAAEEAPTLTQNEVEGNGLFAQQQQEEEQQDEEWMGAQEHHGNNDLPTVIKGDDRNWTSEVQTWEDDREEAHPEDEKEVRELTRQEAQQDVEAIEEMREEEELKDAEGMEREMMEEQIVQASEQEQKYDDDGSVIAEVTDQAQGERWENTERTGECDLFEGNWEWDPEVPLYTNSTCFYIQLNQNCMGNGRPDTDYLHWKWKPRDCDLPRFDATAFLEAFRGKVISFAGDSLARNQMQSLLCMLSQIEIPRLTYQSHDDSSVRWLFEQHQVTLGVVWSPYLLRESDQGVMGFEKGQSVLHLDELDTAWTSIINDLDIIVLSIGQWYFKSSIYVKQGEVVGCHYCPGFNFTQMRYQEVYQGAVRQVLEKVASEFEGIVIMSTFAISHFEEGPWNNGGQCRREKPLDGEEAAKFPGMHNDMHDIVISEFNSIASDKSKHNANVKLEFLDVTRVTLTRADGHPGPYRHPYPYEGKDPNEWVPNDCLHWCLPGPVDTWNQLLVKIAHRHL